MGISSKFLNDHEAVVLDLHPHWWFLVPRGAALVGSMALVIFSLSPDGEQWYVTGSQYVTGALLLAASLVIMLQAYRLAGAFERGRVEPERVGEAHGARAGWAVR